MKILVTGGAGFIGSHTVVELAAKGYDVVIVDNFSNSYPEVLNRLEKITGKKPDFVKADCCDAGAMERVFSENEIGCVIHFAGLKAVGESCGIPVKYYRNNIDSTLTLLETMKRHNVKKFVFSSSATVYGEGNEMPLSEEKSFTGNCSNPYGWTKYMQEVMLKDACTADKDLCVVLLRYFNPIGAHESGLIGEDPQGIPNNLMPYISRVAVGRYPKLSIFGNDYPTPDGTGVRDYIHVVDLAKGHVAAVSYALSHTGCEAFNLGTGNPCSVLEMVKAYSKACGTDIAYEFAPRRAGDLPCVYSDPSKAERVLGFRAQRTLADMCRDSYAFQKRNPDGYRD